MGIGGGGGRQSIIIPAPQVCAALCRHAEAGTRSLAVGSTYTSAPLYSEFLADTVGMETPYEQYGLYLTTLGTLGGVGYCANMLYRARLLAQAVAEQDPNLKEELRMFARVTPDEFKKAHMHIASFRTRGLLAAVSWPLLWLAWRSSHGNVKK